MQTTSIDRVNEDLATIQLATGLGSRLTPQSMWAPLGFAAGGAVQLMYLVLLQRQSMSGWVLLMPCIIGGLLAVFAAHRAVRPEAMKSRERREVWIVGGLLFAGIFGFIKWAEALGMSNSQAGAISFFFIGFTVLYGAVRLRGERFLVAPSLCFMALGLLIPHAEANGLLWSGFFLVFGLSSALAVRLQLRAVHAAD